jgi:hypothetical protein
MVSGISISINGTITEVQIPAKTKDVLDWIRKKYKNLEIQFQGKIQDPLKQTRWLSVFACMSGDEDHVNQHMLPSPFDEEAFTGPIVILSTSIEQADEYDADMLSKSSSESKSDEESALVQKKAARTSKTAMSTSKEKKKKSRSDYHLLRKLGPRVYYARKKAMQERKKRLEVLKSTSKKPKSKVQSDEEFQEQIQNLKSKVKSQQKKKLRLKLLLKMVING